MEEKFLTGTAKLLSSFLRMTYTLKVLLFTTALQDGVLSNVQIYTNGKSVSYYSAKYQCRQPASLVEFRTEPVKAALIDFLERTYINQAFKM